MSQDIQRPKKVSAEQVLYQDTFQKLAKFHAEFEGFSKDYFVIDRGECAAVLVSDHGKILLTKQYRFVVDCVTSEIPSGKVDRGESPEKAAARECLEESGVECRALKPLVHFHTGVDTFKHHAHVYLCEDFKVLEKRSPELCEWRPLAECIEGIFSGKIIDSLSIIALLAYQARSL